jgi:hypothetical protein
MEMHNSKAVLVVAVAMLVGSGVHAATLNIPEGTVVDCMPTPSIEAIKSASVFQGENPALVKQMTCEVIKGQPIPAQLKLVGELRAVAALGPYSIVWQRLQVPEAEGLFEWSGGQKEFASSRIQDTGKLRVTFERGINVSHDSTVISGPAAKPAE